MKKMSVVTLLLLGLTQAASAEEKKVWMGPLVGLNASTVLCDSCEALGVKGRLGLAGGAVFEFLLGEHFAFEFEPMYLQKGANLESGGVKVGSLTYDTFEVPIHAKGRFGSEKVKGVFFLGPQFGFAVARSVNPVSGASSDLPSKSFDFGIHGGGGVEFYLAQNVDLFVNGRIYVGIANLDDGYVNEKARTFGVLTTTGVKFGL